MYDFDDDDVCYECSANGDDYFTNDDGDMECSCHTCIYNESSRYYDDDYDDD